MDFKIDTKEKFTVVTPLVSSIADNMAIAFKDYCLLFMKQPIKNVILNMSMVKTIEKSVAEAITEVQSTFYERNTSFVICEIQPLVNKIFEELEIAEILNQTPTQTEAWDIVQMEEIERELLDSADMSFESNE